MTIIQNSTARGARLKKLRRSSLSEDAYVYLRELFLNGVRYNPGDKVSVEELARELGVSRTPLWGAINRLEAEGLVEVIPRQGVYLIDYDPHRILEIYAAREALEGAAARIAAGKITSRQFASLKSNLEQQRKHLEKGDLNSYRTAALQFHEIIVQVAQNRALDRFLQTIFAQIRAMQVQRQYMPVHLPQSYDDHASLLRAFELRDGDLAEREARRHIRDLAEEVRQLLPATKASIKSKSRVSRF